MYVARMRIAMIAMIVIAMRFIIDDCATYQSAARRPTN